MKKLIATILSIVLIISIMPIGVFTTSAATDGYYKYSVSNGEATITDVDSRISGDVTIPSTLGGYPVTSIGEDAFYVCTGLTSITIPDSVTGIGNYAFFCCDSLTSVTIGNSVTSIGASAFDYCTGLTSVTIPDSVTSIGNYAFSRCTGLTLVTIGNGVKSIGEYAFYGCENLKYNTYGNGKYLGNDTNPYNVLVSTTSKNISEFSFAEGVKCIAGGAFWGCTGLTSVTIPDSVTSIGNYAFSGCTNLTSVTIPDSVTSIGNYAFSGCTNLTSVTIGNGVTSIGGRAFDGCTGLEKIMVDSRNTVYHSSGNCLIETATKTLVMGCKNSVIPTDGSVTSIGGWAFYRCTGLTSVTIGNGVTSIGDYAFYQCTGLTSVTVGNSVTSIGGRAFDGCTGLTSITIPDSVTSIGSYAFSRCTGLTSVTIGNSVTSIGSSAFEHCIRLTTITIPDSVTSIGSSAFSYCAGFTSVTIGNGVTSIGKFAFNGCTGLTSVTIPDSVISMGSYAFDDCTGLTSVTIGNGVTSIGDWAFYGCTGLTSVTIPDSVISMGSYAFRNCTGLTSVTIGNSVTSIGDYAFYDCTGLTSVTIGNGVTSIGDYAFEGCTGLTTVSIGDSVTSIGDRAFYHCTGLTSVTIGNSVTSIGDKAFCGCDSLTSVTIPDSVTSVGSYAFSGCDGLTSVTIGNGVTSIGSYAFNGCDSLTGVYITDLAAWCEIDFEDSSSNPLYYAKKLYINGTLATNIVIPDDVTSIGDYAFYQCDGLTTVTIGNGVTSIGDYAFYDCTGLKDVYYRGSGSDKSTISIGSGNNDLTSATWHCNSCIGSATHNYILNGNLTCSGCKESKTPAAPTLSSKTDTTITLTAISGMEYSKNGTTWQSSPVFTGLTPGTIYTFYQRVAETDTAYVSEKSVGLSVTTMYTPVTPSAPTVASKTDTTVTLTAVSGMEYSKNGTTWQNSNVFEGLSPNTTYTFYQRIAETDAAYASETSEELSVTTKSLPDAPSTPVAIKVTQTSVELQKYNDYEYSKDGTNWQKSSLFEGLTANKTYTFYQRIAETDTASASAASVAQQIKTLEKTACSIRPTAPIIKERATNKIVLLERAGYEYSKNGTSWQQSNVFTGLSSNTNYTFYQRIAETNSELASVKSEGVQGKTYKVATGTTSATNYHKLYDYVERNGNFTSSGDRHLSTPIMVNGEKHNIEFVLKEEGIQCYANYFNNTNNTITIFTSFMLQENAKNMKVTSDIYGTFNISTYPYITIDSANNVITIDRSTYTTEKTYRLPYGGEYITSSQVSNLFNSHLDLIIMLFDQYLYNNLGFGLAGLGFTSYIGYGSTACDLPSSYHNGLTENRNAYDATCTTNGYTGDTYCTSCGEKISSGKAVACRGYHTYSNSCDKTCNSCGEERIISHTYTNDCDAKCNNCNAERAVNHLYDNECDANCNDCGNERKVPHVYDNKEDLICNICGHERSPYTPGDLTGDDKINSLDGLMLMRYLNGWNNLNIASPEAMDVNGDGKVNSLDGLLLMRYLNGWNVQLG